MTGSPDDMEQIFERLLPRDRPYDGQPHTCTGERGRQEVYGVTFRDIRDAFVIGCFWASGLLPEEWPRSLYDLPWDEMDPMAVCQSMLVALEQRMGIFPNLPRRGEVAE